MGEPTVSVSAADVNLQNVREFQRFLDADARRYLNDPEFSESLLDKFDNLDEEGRNSVHFEEAASILLEVCEVIGLDVPIEVLAEFAERYLADPSVIHRSEFIPLE